MITRKYTILRKYVYSEEDIFCSDKRKQFTARIGLLHSCYRYSDHSVNSIRKRIDGITTKSTVISLIRNSFFIVLEIDRL